MASDSASTARPARLIVSCFQTAAPPAASRAPPCAGTRSCPPPAAPLPGRVLPHPRAAARHAPRAQRVRPFSSTRRCPSKAFSAPARLHMAASPPRCQFRPYLRGHLRARQRPRRMTRSPPPAQTLAAGKVRAHPAGPAARCRAHADPLQCRPRQHLFCAPQRWVHVMARCAHADRTAIKVGTDCVRGSAGP
ncbi:hypothetical protein FA95DRAFT_694472 [Auriscalpium vulgare]|uniref:Uncharacterized protein n=1 Tax=Auriscalpium vulgare TaxID=40419 RepID=A0ACB8RC43_9AGAM|nr:hypothetical protein FA95DRAFT_694472 [Auriscalpium vulgare]